MDTMTFNLPLFFADSEPEEVEPGCQFSLNIGLKVRLQQPTSLSLTR